MFIEIQTAVNFLATYLYGNIPRRKVELFVKQLACLLVYYFNYDCGIQMIEINLEGRTDYRVLSAAMDACLEVKELLANLPNSVVLWVAAGQVFLRDEESKFWWILYRCGDEKPNALNMKWILESSGSFEYAVYFAIIPCPTFVLGSTAQCVIVRAQTPSREIRTDQFLMTKFGSMKIKGMSRSSKLSHASVSTSESSSSMMQL